MSKPKDRLLDQFYTTLQTQFIKADDSERDIVHKEIQTLLASENRTWEKAYKVEQLLCHIIPYPMLDIELIKRNAELNKLAKDDFAQTILNSPQRQPGQALSDNHKRCTLLRTINDLQWIAQKKQEAWVARKKAVQTLLSLLGILLLSAFVLISSYSRETLISEHAAPLTSLNQLTQFLLPTITMIGGCLGAAFATLISIYKKYNAHDLRQIRTASNISYIISRISIGSVAALIGALILHTHIVSFDRLYVDRTNFSVAVVAMLLGVLFGFSEAIIPNI